MLFNHFRRSDQGAAAVEFAVVAPLLVLFIFATIDFGRFLSVHNRVTSAVREGARAAAASVVATSADPSDINNRADAKVIQYMSAVQGDNQITAAEVVVTYPNLTNSANPNYGLIFVSLNDNGTGGYRYQPITPFANRIGLQNITLRPTAVFRWEKAD